MKSQKKAANKKKRVFTSNDSIILNRVYDENKAAIEQIKKLFDVLQEKYGVNINDVLKIKEKSPIVPISVFNKELSSLETISKYLKDNCGLNYHNIAVLTGRDERNIWQSYNAAAKKYPKKLVASDLDVLFPVDLLKNTKLSVLETIVWHLKQNYNLKFSEISRLLHRDTKTVWTCYMRALKKNGK